MSTETAPTRTLDGPKAPTLLRFDAVHSWRSRSPLTEEYALAALLDAVVYANLGNGQPTQRMDSAAWWAADTLTQAIPVPRQKLRSKNWPKIALDCWVRWEQKKLAKAKP